MLVEYREKMIAEYICHIYIVSRVDQTLLEHGNVGPTRNLCNLMPGKGIQRECTCDNAINDACNYVGRYELRNLIQTYSASSQTNDWYIKLNEDKMFGGEKYLHAKR